MDSCYWHITQLGDFIKALLQCRNPVGFRFFVGGERGANFILELVQLVADLFARGINLFGDFFVLVGESLTDAVQIGLGLRDCVGDRGYFLAAFRCGQVWNQAGCLLADICQQRFKASAVSE